MRTPLLFAAVVVVWPCAVLGAVAPPTLDPTYGMALPPEVKPKGDEVLANWVWSAPTATNETLYLRGAVDLPQGAKSAVLWVTADDSFEVFVNGEKVGASPSPGHDSDWATPHSFRVADRLVAGRNVIGVRAVNQGGGAGVLVRLDVEGKNVLVSDESWRVAAEGDVPGDWAAVDYSDGAWAMAAVVARYGEGPWGKLADWPGTDTGYMAHREIAPKSVVTVAGGSQVAGTESLGRDGTGKIEIAPGAVLIVDFGQELAGRLQVWGTDGAAVTVHTGESREECDKEELKLNNNGPFDLVLAGSEPAATPYTAFRFAKLTFPKSSEVEITRIVCDHKYYPVVYKGSFDCSDPLLTKIWYTGAYTAHLGMQEEIWDAPKRDRGLWIGDLQVTGQAINTVFGDRLLMERSICLVREQAQGGRPATELPATDVNTIPGYSAAWYCTLADYYRHQGNKDFLETQHQAILTLLEYQRGEFDAQGVYVNGAKWDFCDWATDFVTDGPLARAATHLYIIYGVREAVYLLRELGDTANAEKYAKWADELAAAARKQFLVSATKTYTDRLQVNVMAVLSGTASPEEEAQIYAKVLKADNPGWIAHPTGNIDTSAVLSPYYGYFVLEAMGRLGKRQDGVDFIRRYWGDMLKRGATTWWEKFDPTWDTNFQGIIDMMPYISLCHGWSTGPTTFLTEWVLGVRPTGAGYKTVEIRPELGDLKWAEGNVPTPDGVIHVRVDRDGIRQTVVVNLPAGVVATIGIGAKVLRADRAGVYRLSTP